jgi:hypothetical protein
MKYLAFEPTLLWCRVFGILASLEECDVDYDLSHAVAILREAHIRLAGADMHRRVPAMADLEMAGVRTGALRVAVGKLFRRKKAPGHLPR